MRSQWIRGALAVATAGVVTLIMAMTVSAEPGPVPAPQSPRRAINYVDLTPVQIRFEVVKHGTYGPNDTPCQWYNVRPIVKNAGNQNSGAFGVRLEREVGGAWAPGCLTCTYDVANIKGGGQYTVKGPQANTCGSTAPRKWRVTVDYKGSVTESNEHNNMLERTFIYIPKVPMRRRP